MPDCFEILHKDLAGRIGRLSTPHGTVETPALMPVVNPHIQILTVSELRSMGSSIIITNSYIISQDEALREKALDEGVHSLLGFEGPVMTDSGAFQLSVYGQVGVTPHEILAFQSAIQSDICVPLDIPTPPDAPRERAVQELGETERRLEEALARRGRFLLAGPIQGSTFSDLRERAARFAREKGFDVYPVGGVVPLMEAYRFRDLVEVVASAKRGLGSAAPVHLFGAGHPMLFSLAAAMGCDLFDSAAYAIFAREGRYLTSRGTWRLEEMRYLPCPCPVCEGNTAQELRESPERIRLLARHNLYASFAEMRLVKQSIREGSLWNMLEARSRSHPRLLDGFRSLGRKGGWLEGLDVATKSTFFYLGPDSALRPEVIRYASRVERLELQGRVLITDDPGEDRAGFDRVLHFKPPFGPYPLELSETYPLNAEVPAETDPEAIKQAMLSTKRLMEANSQASFSLRLRKGL
jgi:7-cyano-7-deazaguanine tRNA-ribosyltransferase